MVNSTSPETKISSYDQTTTTKREKETEKVPVTSLWVSTHGGHFHSRSQMHPFIFLHILIRTAEESGHGSRLPGLLEAAH